MKTPKRSTRRFEYASRLTSMVCIFASSMLAIGLFGTSSARAADSLAAPAAFTPVAPCRLHDQRELGAPAAVVVVSDLQECGVPATATSVSVTLTAVAASAPGHLTAWSGVGAQPVVSNLNFAPWETRANSAIVAVSSNGSFTVASNTTPYIVVDVTGYFAPAPAVRAGRYTPLGTTVRAVDTRTGGALQPNHIVRVPLPAGVPADATALSITLTTADSPSAGFLTAFPAGTVTPETSSLNTDESGQTRAAGHIVPVSAEGLDVLTSNGQSIIVDVNGYFTGPSAATTSAGLYVATTPERIVDTRLDRRPLWPNRTVDVAYSTSSEHPVGSLVVNNTMVGTLAPSHVTLFPSTHPNPGTSNVNADRGGQTVAAASIVPISSGLSISSLDTTHFIVDVFGYFTGERLPTFAPVTPPASNVLLVGDSSMAGIRWYTDSHSALGGNATYTLEAESCRRLIGVSCRGREQRAPVNAVTEIQRAADGYDTVVIQTGYNDSPNTFNSAFQQTVAAARAKGIDRIVWLTYRAEASYVNFQFNQSLGNGFARMNEILFANAASGMYPDVVLADYATYTKPVSGEWFASDGVHFTVAGAYGTADYISRVIAWMDRFACSQPYAIGLPIENPCSHPDLHTPVNAIEIYHGNPDSIHCYEIGVERRVVCRPDVSLNG